MASDGKWFGNLINAVIVYFIGAILLYTNVIWNILGMHSFAYDTLVGLNLFPAQVTSAEVQFNWGILALIAWQLVRNP